MFCPIVPFIQVDVQWPSAGFKDKESPAATTKKLGIPEKPKTIARYKTAVWDLKDIVANTKEIRAEKHESRRNEAIDKIIVASLRVSFGLCQLDNVH